MSDLNSKPTCAITGSSGYLGSNLCSYLRNNKFKVIELNRKVNNINTRIFNLGLMPSKNLFKNIDILIHCAYDTEPHSIDKIREINVHGTEKLFSVAYEAGVKRIIYISSAAAYKGCKSTYGKIKLEIENIAYSYHALILRPCLIYGNNTAGIFGRLSKVINSSYIIPIIGNGNQPIYLVHIDDLCEFLIYFIEKIKYTPKLPITAGYPTSYTLKDIIQTIALHKKMKPLLIPIPWRIVWFLLKICEICKLNFKFSSDNLLGLNYPNTNHDFTINESIGLTCRPFK
jgi:nucleoside-diphosphate-sugar epimerase